MKFVAQEEFVKEKRTWKSTRMNRRKLRFLVSLRFVEYCLLTLDVGDLCMDSFRNVQFWVQHLFVCSVQYHASPACALSFINCVALESLSLHFEQVFVVWSEKRTVEKHALRKLLSSPVPFLLL